MSRKFIYTIHKIFRFLFSICFIICFTGILCIASAFDLEDETQVVLNTFEVYCLRGLICIFGCLVTGVMYKIADVNVKYFSKPRSFLGG